MTTCCVLEQARHEVIETQLQRRDIDGHAHGRQAGALPVLAVGRRALDDPVPDLDDQAAALQDPQEVRRGDETGVRIVPTNERLDAFDPARFHVHLGLIVELELFGPEHSAQLSVQRDPCEGRGVALDAVLPAAFTCELGGAQGRFRFLNERIAPLHLCNIFTNGRAASASGSIGHSGEECYGAERGTTTDERADRHHHVE